MVERKDRREEIRGEEGTRKRKRKRDKKRRMRKVREVREVIRMRKVKVVMAAIVKKGERKQVKGKEVGLKVERKIDIVDPG